MCQNRRNMCLLFIISRLTVWTVGCGSVENRQQLWNYSTVGDWLAQLLYLSGCQQDFKIRRVSLPEPGCALKSAFFSTWIDLPVTGWMNVKDSA